MMDVVGKGAGVEILWEAGKGSYRSLLGVGQTLCRGDRVFTHKVILLSSLQLTRS